MKRENLKRELQQGWKIRTAFMSRYQPGWFCFSLVKELNEAKDIWLKHIPTYIKDDDFIDEPIIDLKEY